MRSRLESVSVTRNVLETGQNGFGLLGRCHSWASESDWYIYPSLQVGTPAGGTPAVLSADSCRKRPGDLE